MGVTIKDVAKKTGMSASTVSLVLNNKAKKNRISEKTTKLITEVASQLNYPVKNRTTEIKKTVGIITSVNFSICYSNLFSVIDATCRNSGYYFAFASITEYTEKEEPYLEDFLAGDICAVIIDPTFMNVQTTEKLRRIVEKFEIPQVYLGMLDSTLFPNSFTPNLFQAGIMGCSKLVEAGKMHLGIVTDKLWQVVADQLMLGALEFLEEKKFATCRIIDVSEFSQGMHRILSEDLDGLFFMSEDLLNLYLSSTPNTSDRSCILLKYMNSLYPVTHGCHSICISMDRVLRKSIHFAISLIEHPEKKVNPEIFPVLYQ